jgi:polygalacturonase
MSRVHTEATRIHRVNDLSFSTETAMRASTYVAADVGKVYRCTGSGHIYVLASVGPATFRRLTSDTVSVKDHGATGDGTTDDSAAIASAAESSVVPS